MPSIYHETEKIAASNAKLLFGVSLGRDTACMLHLFANHARRVVPNFKMQDHKFVHWTPYDTMLPYQARLLNILKALYKIEVEVRPDPVSYSMKGVRTVAQERDLCLANSGAEYMVMGYRMDESLQRRGMMKRYADWLNPDLHEAYPLRSWTSRITDNYVRVNRIMLSPEYAYGMRDCRNHKGMRAVWLREIIGEQDYQAALAQDPSIEIDYVRNYPIYKKLLDSFAE